MKRANYIQGLTILFLIYNLVFHCCESKRLLEIEESKISKNKKIGFQRKERETIFFPRYLPLCLGALPPSSLLSPRNGRRGGARRGEERTSECLCSDDGACSSLPAAPAMHLPPFISRRATRGERERERETFRETEPLLAPFFINCSCYHIHASFPPASPSRRVPDSFNV